MNTRITTATVTHHRIGTKIWRMITTCEGAPEIEEGEKEDERSTQYNVTAITQDGRAIGTFTARRTPSTHQPGRVSTSLRTWNGFTLAYISAQEEARPGCSFATLDAPHPARLYPENEASSIDAPTIIDAIAAFIARTH